MSKIKDLVRTDNMAVWGDKDDIFVNIVNYNVTVGFTHEAYKEFASAIAKAKREMKNL